MSTVTLVRNNKTAPVSLPLKKGKKLLPLKPGTHNYPEAMVSQIDTSRTSVRSYLESAGPGVLPVIEIDPEGMDRADALTAGPQKTAAEPVVEIKDMVDVDQLQRFLAEDQRSTVTGAARKRLDELQEMVSDTGDDNTVVE